MSRSIAPFPDFDTLLAFAYDELPSEAAQQIARQVQTNKRLELLVSGILSIRQHEQFTTREEHQAWLVERQQRAEQQVVYHIKRQKRRKKIRLLSYAATLVGLCWYIFSWPQNSAEKLYAHYQIGPAAGEVLTLSQSLQESGMGNQVLGLLDQEDYDTALSGLNQLLDQHPTSAGIRYLAGFCYLQTGKTEEARVYFSAVSQSAAHPLISQHALWQLGLSYLRAKDLDHAIESFQAVRASLDPSLPGARKLDRKARRLVRRAKIRRFAVQMYGRFSDSFLGAQV